MDSTTGKVYGPFLNLREVEELETIQQTRPDDLVQLTGSPEAIARISRAVKDKAKAKRKQAASSRKKNR